MSAFDPDLIKLQLSRLPFKLAECGHDIPSMHAYVDEKELQLASTGETSSDVVTHLMTAYRSHPDPEIVQYAERQYDNRKDKGKKVTAKWLRKKVEGKVYRIKAKEDLAALHTADDIHVLESRVQGNRRSHSNHSGRSNGGRGRGNGGRGRGRSNSRSNSNAGRGNQGGRGRSGGRTNGRSRSNSRRRYQPPRELRNVPKPDNPNQSKMVRGKEFFWCDNHSWCGHKTVACENPDDEPSNNGNNNSNSNGNGGGRGDRNGRRVSAYTSLIQRGRETLETVQE